MRQLAQVLGLSLATVSDSMRGLKRVNVSTRERVRKAAAELGYVYNPLAGSVMSEIRRSSGTSFRGTVAVVDLERPLDRSPGAAAYHQLVNEGAEEAAQRLGYRVDFFNVAESRISIKRLSDILESRGIAALLVLPMFGRPDLTALNWKRLTGVYTDYTIEDPPINRISPDHFKSMLLALKKLTEMGYQRPGLVLQERLAERMMFRLESAFEAFRSHQNDGAVSEHLIFGQLDRDRFVEWFQATQPDVVMSHRAEVLDWMRQLGCRVPRTHGFCCLNVTTVGIKTAGLDLMPHMVGRRGMETLIAQLQRNESGVPGIPLISTYEAAWQKGPTLRNLATGTNPRVSGKPRVRKSPDRK